MQDIVLAAGVAKIDMTELDGGLETVRKTNRFDRINYADRGLQDFGNPFR